MQGWLQELPFSPALLFLVFQLEFFIFVRVHFPVVFVPVVGVLERLGAKQAGVGPFPAVYVHVVPVAGLALEAFAADTAHVPLEVVGSVGGLHVVLEPLGVELLAAMVTRHLGGRVDLPHVKLVRLVVLKQKKIWVKR